MKKQRVLLNKTLVIAILILFIGMSVVSSTGNIGKGSFIYKSNNPPYEPSDPIPPDGAENVFNISYICWTGGDPDGDEVIYDVFFGKSSPPPLVYANITSNCTIPPGSPEFNTTYYWKIVATDEHGASTEGPIWSFTTRGNSPPMAPIIFEENGSLFIYTIDPDGDDIFYLIDWDDGETSGWIGPYLSGEILEISHEWPEGIYEIRAKAKDIYGAESPWSDPYKVVIGNDPPTAPIIKGETSGKAGKEYDYTFNATDSNGDDVKYYICWGDNTTYETEFNASGTEVIVNHTWSEDGTFNITAKAQDIHGLNSSEGTLTVEIPRNRARVNSLFQLFFDRFPLLEVFLRAMNLLR